MFNEKFWLALVFVAFAALIAKYVLPIILKILDKKSQQISEQILQVKELKEKAKSLLDQAEQYHQESLRYAEKLTKDAEVEVQKFLLEAKKSAEEEVEKKLASANEKIRLEEKVALREVKNKIIQSALEAVEKSVSESPNKDRDDYFFELASKDLDGLMSR